MLRERAPLVLQKTARQSSVRFAKHHKTGFSISYCLLGSNDPLPNPILVLNYVLLPLSRKDLDFRKFKTD